jgi:alpha-tubulin suppressor-like RCC1 family protein
MIGRTKRPLTQPFDLTIPTSILPSLKVTRVIASCSAAHALCIDTNGVAYGWGRNEALQLSQSLPTAVVPLPTMLEYDFDSVVVDGAVGKSHTLLLTQKGEVYSVGANKAGQCGVRNNSTSVVNFRKCVGLEHETVVQVSCGEDFSVALCNDGHVYSTGSSEFGQLGNGDPGEYIVTAGKSGFANCNVFTKRDVYCHVPGEMHMAGMMMGGGNDSSSKVVVPMQEHVRIGYIACGKHHTVAIEATCTTNSSDEAILPPPPPRVFTWGCGNYGCLGHGVQQDEYHPRLVATLSSGPLWTSNPPVRAAAGSSCTMILTERGHVYYCGRHRSVAEAVMRPTLLDALANNNHVVTHIAAGNATVVCSTANGATVSWGMGPHGELGYGDKKSSAKPDFIPKLDSCRIRDLACGQGITLFAIAEEDADDKKAIQKLPVLDAQDVKSLES